MTCDLSFALGRIYDAALESALWPDALAQVCGYVSAARGMLIVEDGVTAPQAIVLYSLVDPWSQRDLETRIQLDPAGRAVAATAKTGDIILTTQIMSRDAFRATRFYSDWLQPRGLVDDAVAIVERSAARSVILALQRDAIQGPADAAMRARIADVVPHLSRALAMGQALDRAFADLACFRAILDRARSALVVVDTRSRLVHANAGARRLLEAGVLVCTARGELRASDAGVGDPILIALARAAGDTRCADDAFVAVLSGAEDKYLASVLPLDPRALARIGAPAGQMTAVFLRPLGASLVFDPTPLATCYGLTPRELTVMITLVETAGVPETAQILGLSTATVRSHLKAIYRKTGTNRQSELAKLAASAEPEFPAQAAAVVGSGGGISRRLLN